MRKLNKKTRAQKSAEQLNIIDDAMFEKMAEDPGFCEEVISTIINRRVIVKRVVQQKSIRNLQGRSVRLDALCEFLDGSECNVEVHKKDDDHHEKRMRYNASCITANITDPGIKFEKVPDVISIFISKFDLFKAGRTIYHIERTVRETGEVRDNGVKEIYVNTKIDDGSDLAELMHIFTEQSAYDFEKFPKTSKRKEYFLKDEGGKEEMCEIVEKFAKECVKEENMETARKLFENGVSFELVRRSLDSLSDQELKTIFDGVKKQ